MKTLRKKVNNPVAKHHQNKSGSGYHTDKGYRRTTKHNIGILSGWGVLA